MAEMSAGSDYVKVHDFYDVDAKAGTAGDIAKLIGDTAHVNQLTYSLDTLKGTMDSANRHDHITGFGSVFAYAGTKSDSANLYGSKTIANYFDAGPQLAEGNPTNVIETTFVADPSLVDTFGFHFVTAHSGTLSDVAHLTGMANETNTFTAHGNDGHPTASMTGADYAISTDGFHYVRGAAGTANDQAFLYGDNPTWNDLGASVSDGMGIGDGTYDMVAAGFKHSKVHFG
jgi:hypothetical protein